MGALLYQEPATEEVKDKQEEILQAQVCPRTAWS